ncbi:hypothetical protein Lal_00012841 [Lupinus albus]|nr:hypothetical protein Lal_00012841 [Lupinus albus]
MSLQGLCNRELSFERGPEALPVMRLCQQPLMWQGTVSRFRGQVRMEQRRLSQSFKRKELVAKLNPTGVRAFKAAADTAKLRGNPYVELVHFIQQLVLSERSDVQMILADAGIDASRLTADMTRAIDKLPYGATSVEEFSDHIFHAIQEGWNLATLEFGVEEVRSAHILSRLPEDAGAGRPCCEDQRRIRQDRCGRGHFPLRQCHRRVARARLALRRGCRRDTDKTRPWRGFGAGQIRHRPHPARPRWQDRSGRRSRSGDPPDRRHPNAAPAEQSDPDRRGRCRQDGGGRGFALRIAQGDVPPTLQNVSVRMLDVGLMQAGASVKGEFEKRLKAVIDEVQASEVPIILFIDEAHTLIGAGGAAGTGDAANLLKPALARGELRTIAATTWAEYKQHIEKDPALTRRFQVVKIDEPSEAVAVLMLRGVAGVLEQHHKVQILDEAIEAAVSLSHRYIPARQLPDKAVSLLDTACARVAVSQHATPAEVEDILRRRQALEVEQGIIGREAAIGIDVADRQVRVEAGLAETETTLAAAQARWDREKALVTEILDLRAKLRGEGMPLDAVEGEEAVAGEGTGVAAGNEASETKTPETKAPEAKTAETKVPKTKVAKVKAAKAEAAATGDVALGARFRGGLVAVARIDGRTCRGAGRDAADPALGRPQRGRGRGAGLDRHPDRKDALQPDREGAETRRHAVRARRRSGPRDGDDRQTRADQSRRLGRAGEAGRRVPALRAFGCR